MSTSTHQKPERLSVEIGGEEVSYLHMGAGRPLLLLHGTFWSRVWEPAMPALASAGVEAFAVDFPGCGASTGRLEREQATAPALARWAGRFIEAVAPGAGRFSVGGHDIGGAVAQQLAASDARVDRMALMNSVLFDSWPVPAVERFRDPEVAASITVEEFLEARAQSLGKAVARPLSDDEQKAWLAPWHSEDRVRSWTAMAAAADSRFTLEVVDNLTRKALPTLLVWGVEDEFQPLSFAQRYASELPNAELVRIPAARHIPTADDPAAVGEVMARFFA